MRRNIQQKDYEMEDLNDYYGSLILENMYDFYILDVGDFRMCLKKHSVLNNYLQFNNA